MDGDELSTLVDELNSGASIGTTLKFQLINLAKAMVEQRRPWMILRATDTSKTITAANTWQTPIDLSAIDRFSQFYEDDISPPIKLFDGNQTFYGYQQRPFNQRLQNITNPATFVFDEGSKALYLNGTPPFAGTLWIDHIKFTESLDEESSATAWPFPSWSHGLLAFLAVGIHKGGVDFDDINRLMAADNRGTAEIVIARLEKWDNDKQLIAISHTDPTGSSGSFVSGKINMNND